MEKMKWLLDPAHSEIYFKVKHLMITTVTGYFRTFTATVFTEDDGFNTINSIEFIAETNSIDTNNTQRDEHLKSAEFFDATKYKVITFSSTKYEVSGAERKMYGHLTIGAITNPVIIDIEFGGIAVDGYGQTKAGFTINGKINRKDFGLTWGAVTEAGNVIVSDEVKIHGEIQLIKQS